jgi:hypothetical protein
MSDEYEAYLNSLKKQAPKQNDNVDEYIQYLNAQGRGNSLNLPSAKDVSKEAVGLAGKILDYGGGWVGVGATKASDALLDTNLSKPGDAERALMGEAPSTSEYLERGGAPELGSVKIPLTQKKITGRDVLGFAGDVVRDPLTLGGGAVAKLSRSLAKKGEKSTAVEVLDRALNPVGRGAEEGGKGIYQSGFKKIDERLREEGLGPLSKVAWDNGRMTGTTASLKDQLLSLKDSLLGKRDQLYKKVDEAGARVDPGNSAIPAYEYINKMQARSPHAEAKTFDQMREYVARGVTKDPEIAAKAQAKYDGELSQYLKDYRAFLKNNKQYKGAVGQAGNDLSQPAIPGMIDDLQRTQSKPQTFELNGVDRTGEQLGLIPQQIDGFQFDLTKQPSYRYNVKGGIERRQVRDPEQFATKLFKQEIDAANAPIPLADKPLVVQDMTSIGLGEGQLTAPLLPTRPNRPVMMDVPNKTYSTSKASDVKSTLRNSLPDSAWGPFYVKDDWHNLDKALSGGYQREIEKSANAVLPGVGDEIKGLNQTVGTIIEAENPLKMQVRRANSINAVTPVDMALGAMNIKAEAAKKLGDLSKTTWFRTKTGKFMNALGETDMLDPAIRQMMIESERPTSPWDKMQSR